ncbi:FhaA domain-containing protein [Pseudofrankia sp. DC12]|uniref:FhaA domain-containing protein n=1 Tax=Pseudofrankia sp. DC12 TaxID=683315 RepID=UPI0005F7D532|nr:FhaA domain-containing protein [Pseudofrankia sp. DC12]
MGVLQRFERRLGGLVEGAFAKVFKGGVEPVEIAGALAREADDRRAISSNRVLVPNEFAVELASPDYNRLSPYSRALCDELAEMVREHAAEQRYTFVGPVSIRLTEAADLDVGVFRIRSSVASAEGMVATPPRRGPRAAPGAPRLLITNKEAPPGREREYELTAESTLIGRSVECDIRLTDTGVSRRHGEIRRMSDGNWLYVDAGSTNGSIVNGRPATQVKLVNGDLIELGAALVTFQRDDGRGGRDSREPGRMAAEAPEPFGRQHDRELGGGPDAYQGGRPDPRDRQGPRDRPDPRDRPGPRGEPYRDRLDGPARPVGNRSDEPFNDRSGARGEPYRDRPPAPGRPDRPGARPDEPFDDRSSPRGEPYRDRSGARGEPYRDGTGGRPARPGPDSPRPEPQREDRPRPGLRRKDSPRPVPPRPDAQRQDSPRPGPPRENLQPEGPHRQGPRRPEPADDRSGPRAERPRDDAYRGASSARNVPYRDGPARGGRDARDARPRQDGDSDEYPGQGRGYGRRGDGSGPHPAGARRASGRDNAGGRDGRPPEEIYDAEKVLPGRAPDRPRPDEPRRRPGPPPPSDRSW